MTTAKSLSRRTSRPCRTDTRAAAARPRFLLVEDNEALARALAARIKVHADVVVAGNVKDALGALRVMPGPWSGFVFDVGLPDGLGLDVLEEARTAHPHTPALVLTGSFEAKHINRACALRALYLIKDEITGEPANELVRFVQQAIDLRARLENAAGVWLLRYGLTTTEVDVLVRAAMGQNREAIANERGSSLNTVRSHIASLLAKTGDASLLDAANRLLREALPSTDC